MKTLANLSDHSKIKTITIEGLKISYLNEKELNFIAEDIFVKQEYHFSSKVKNPEILDVGAHIGLASLYFKKLYPNAKIVAFEPNPSNFKLLRRNISQNYLKGINLVNAAVNKKGKTVDFYIDNREIPWSWGDSTKVNSWYDNKSYKKIKTKAVRLSDYIASEIDLLKIDIEGGETEVINEILKKINFIKKIYMEFHSNPRNSENNIFHILNILSRNNFKLHALRYNRPIPSFLTRIYIKLLSIYKKNVFQLNIHAIRNETFLGRTKIKINN